MSLRTSRSRQWGLWSEWSANRRHPVRVRRSGSSHSLYVNVGHRYVFTDGICHMENGESGAVLVCSQPLTAQESWLPLPVNHLIGVDDDLLVAIRPLDL